MSHQRENEKLEREIQGRETKNYINKMNVVTVFAFSTTTFPIASMTDS